MGEDLTLFLADVFICAVVVGVLYGIRRTIRESQAWRDFLGVTMTFVILTGIGFIMIVAEHYLG
jgi:hypothetical protein